MKRINIESIRIFFPSTSRRTQGDQVGLNLGNFTSPQVLKMQQDDGA